MYPLAVASTDLRFWHFYVMQSAGVLFIDTERKFSSQRILQMEQAKQPDQLLSRTAKDSLLGRIHILHSDTPEDLLSRLKVCYSKTLEQC